MTSSSSSTAPLAEESSSSSPAPVAAPPAGIPRPPKNLDRSDGRRGHRRRPRPVLHVSPFSIVPLLTAIIVLLLSRVVVVAPDGDGGGAARSISLRDVAMHLRAGDLRLVHFDSSDLTRERQGDGDDSCGPRLDEAYRVLTAATGSDADTSSAASPLPDDVVHATRVVTLCTTDNPTVRSRLPLHDDDGGGGGVPESLAAVMRNFAAGIGDGDPGVAAEAAAAAAETVWISSFASARNHAAFSEAGGVADALVDLLCSVDCAAPGAEAEAVADDGAGGSGSASPHCHHALMWAAAAVQNLAASYCRTDSGHCWWEWEGGGDGDGDGDRHSGRKVTLHPDSPLLVDAEATRRRLLGNGCLLTKLEALVCAGPVDEPHGDVEYPWPSRAQILPDYFQDEDDGDRHTSSQVVNGATLVPWAAVGAIKNLALSQAFPRPPPATLVHCLCDHAVRGPDWLEFTKAQSALYNMGLDLDEVCEPIYDPAECRDDPIDWADGEGNGCGAYGEERWCVEYGADETDERGVSADRACCACGGGVRTEDRSSEEL